MLPDDGPNRPKHVGAIYRDILSVSCSILCCNTECICWQRNFELIKMHGKTTIKTQDNFKHIFCVTVKEVTHDL
jgi:hypothetical protein